MFNLPRVVVGVLGVLVGVQALRSLALGPDADFELILAFAFIPARVTEMSTVGAALPGGVAASLWSFVTYAFLHANWSHLLFNGLWLAAFGTPLAWRFGTGRFLGYSALGAIGGAALHLAVHADDLTPMIGASAAISAHMAGASRFVFSAGGPLGALRGIGRAAYRQPVPPLAVTIRDPRVMMFLGVWFGLNLLFGIFGGDAGLASGAIAWEAHIGGFLTGLLFFSVFDPVSQH